MKYIFPIFLAASLLLTATISVALTVDEITKLKKAGVSDAVIEKMLEQEAAGVQAEGPMVETEDSITYSAGKDARAKAQQNEQHERWKEKKAMEALDGVIIDQRTTE